MNDGGGMTGAVCPSEVQESVPERHARLTGQAIDKAFVARYILALVGIWVALLTPASVTLALRVGQLVPDEKAEALAFVASLGAAAALFANPVFGALSDRSTLRWGQRRPFIIGGLFFGGLAVMAIGFADSIAGVAIGWVAAQLAFNAAITALVAILPERIPHAMRGRVAGFMGMAPQLGIVGGTFLIQLVGTEGHQMFFWPVVLGVLMTLPFAFTLKETPREAGEVKPIGIGTIFGALWINPIAHRDFALAWLGRFCVWIALYLLTNYKTYFLIDRLGYTTETVPPILTAAMFTLAGCIVVSSLFGGWISDRIDRRKPFVVFASFLYIFTMIIVAMATTVQGFLIGIALSGLAAGLYLGVDYALVARVLPNDRDEAARGMGLFNLSSTIPQTLAPVIAPVFLAIGATGTAGNYTSLFLAGAGAAFVGAIITQFIRTR